MKKLGNSVTFSGLLLAAVSVFSQTAGYFNPRLAVLGSAAHEALTVATILLMVAVLVRFSAKPTSKPLSRQVGIFFWIGAISVVALSSCRVAESLTARSEKTVIEEFQKLYHNKVVFDSYFLGVQSVQFPADSWVMQEILTEIRPDFLVETGTGKGGTTLFYATILEQLRGGKIITVDIDDHDRTVTKFVPWRERVRFIKGSSVSPDVFDQIKGQVDGRKVVVTLTLNIPKNTS
jgi:hypothetical protein